MATLLMMTPVFRSCANFRFMALLKLATSISELLGFLPTFNSEGAVSLDLIAIARAPRELPGMGRTGFEPVKA